MNAREFELFARAFHRAVLVFDKQVSQADESLLAQSYFKVLQAYPLGAVLQCLKHAMETAARLPKPMELLERLTTTPAGHAGGVPPALSVSRREMTSQEMQDYADAASSGFQRPPCDCYACVSAHISHQPIRFVPTLTEDGDTELRAVNPHTKRYDVVGHWAHGEELKRWYTTRRAFFDRLKKAPKGLAPVLAFVGREPGEEG